jgi:hypothetical protein
MHTKRKLSMYILTRAWRLCNNREVRHINKILFQRSHNSVKTFLFNCGSVEEGLVDFLICGFENICMASFFLIISET